MSLARFAEEVTGVVDGIDGPVVLVGQSMGAQVDSGVLVSPVPLHGTRLPDDDIAHTRASAGNLTCSA
ncbi:hypothetical protein [Kutzneria buriramensis]|uniref:Esterase n=1 Tax=Kutzneria buriramensis TaxID=1045776 RepID=A0A3E0HIR1_9PSEU|nr:hypothetical protein [Kutzneria buriramensis]REH46321.1 esterase [Kutzneria buriramensis]